MADLLPIVRGLPAVDFSVFRVPCLATLLTGLLLSPLAVAQTAHAGLETLPQEGAAQEGAAQERAAQERAAREKEAADVQRLHGLLAAYHSEKEAYARTMQAVQGADQGETQPQGGNTEIGLPFSPGKVHLNGSEASAALAQISQRLANTDLEKDHPDIAPTYSIETRLYGTLVGSDSRSLKPVGGNNFVARTRLLPGKTTVRILQHSWQLSLPQDASAQDVLVTFYTPLEGDPELHIFAIDDLLAQKNPHIPTWLTDGLKITTRAG